VTDTYDIAIDYMDMTDDRHLWVRSADVDPGVTPSVGGHYVVGQEDADPSVARVVAIDDDGFLELEILKGPVAAHRDLLRPT
jgi:hypothetical protein